MIGRGFDKMSGCWMWNHCSTLLQVMKSVGFSGVFFCLHTIALRVFHAKIRAFSSLVHKLKDGCYLSVLEEPQIKL